MMIIVGSFIMDPSSILTLNASKTGAALMSVEGVAEFSGTLILTLDGPPPSTGRLVLIKLKESKGQFTSVEIISPNPSCHELSYEPSALVVLFDTMTCSAPVLVGIVPWLLILIIRPFF